jgi:hypothetical protein
MNSSGRGDPQSSGVASTRGRDWILGNTLPAAELPRHWSTSVSGRREGDTALEQSLDEAMARHAQAAAELEPRPSTPAEALSSGTLALSAPAQPGCSALVAPTRLSWKGMEVSDEFRRYAERVARGEELLPYRGQVLAQHSDAFPWGLGGRREPGRRGPRASRNPVWLLALGALLGAALVSGVRAAVVAGSDPHGPELTRAVSALEAERSSPPAPAQHLDPRSASGSVSHLLGHARLASTQPLPSAATSAAAAPAPRSATKRTSTPRQRSSTAARRSPARLNAPSTTGEAGHEASGGIGAALSPPPGALPFREEAAIFERAPANAPTALLLELPPF